jgi:hypothetical protein
MKPHAGGHKAAEREEALKAAEGHVVRPGPEDTKVVRLKATEIETHPVLFQPREFLVFRRDRTNSETDPEYVKDLQKRISIKGELDPLTVIKLDTAWVIVDGHHRLAAYRELGWKQPLRCLWFDGTARQAMDAAAESSLVLKLTAARADRDEMAWQRVLMGGWRREDIRKICCVSPNLITRMRKVVDWFNDKTVRTTERYEFRKQTPNLKDAGWMQANLAYLGATPEQRDDEMRAQALARRMRERFDGRHSLSLNPKITAMAIERYDRKLPAELQETWQGPDAEASYGKAAQTLGAFDESEGLLNIPLTSNKHVLRQALQRYREQAQRVEDELERRKAGGTAGDHPTEHTTNPYEPTQPWVPEPKSPTDL